MRRPQPESVGRHRHARHGRRDRARRGTELDDGAMLARTWPGGEGHRQPRPL